MNIRTNLVTTEAVQTVQPEISERERKRYYLSEFSLWDSDHFVTFNIVDINTDRYGRNEITLAVTDEGRISIRTFDLVSDGLRFYFEYGPTFSKLDLADFEQIDANANSYAEDEAEED